MRHAGDFFAFARERETIRLRREEEMLPPPWTSDPVLQRFFFCNVFREDDKLTRWFRDNVRDQVAEDAEKSVLACTVFRWFNHIPSGEVLAPYLRRGRWPKDVIRWRLKKLPQVVGGAYLIKSPAGMDKVDGLLECIDPVRRAAHDLGWASSRLGYTLEHMHQELMCYPYLGRFMAYEIVTDLRHTCVLRGAPDILTWASAGPGCTRGLGWVAEDDPTTFSYGAPRQQRGMLAMMRELLEMSRDFHHWPASWRRWEMREVEHVLCEFSKYRVAQTGGRVKRKFDAHDSYRSQRAPGTA